MIWNSKPIFGPPVNRSRMRMTVVRTVTISSTNITGFLINVRGSSFANAEPIAGNTILRSNKADAGIFLRSVELSMGVTPKESELVERAGSHRELLDDWPECESREEGEATDDHNHTDGKPDEQAAGGGERAGRRRHDLLGRQGTSDRHHRDDHPETAD